MPPQRWLPILGIVAVLTMSVGCPDEPTTLGDAGLPQERVLYPWNTESIALVVDPELPYRVRTSLDQFEADLAAAGYTIIERLTTFSTPQLLRTWLAATHANATPHLAGAILIGNMPKAYQYYVITYTNPGIPPTPLEAISYQYYADLDGTFTASAGYVSPGGHVYSYDEHGGDLDWEIWVGVLPFYQQDYGQTADVLIDYFGKNHVYRMGSHSLPPRYVEIDELHTAATLQDYTQLIQDLQSGAYSWTPFSDSGSAQFFFNCPATDLTAIQGYTTLGTTGADFVAVGAHGSGLVNTAWALSNAILVPFFWHDGCTVANLEDPDNFLTAVLYSPYSDVIVAKGATNYSTGLGTNQDGCHGHNIATGLTLGMCLGATLQDHVNTPLLWPWSDNRESFYAPTVILGDPSLTIWP